MHLSHRYVSILLVGLAMLLQGCALTMELSTTERRQIAGKTYVVTGASSGFGRGVALKLGRLKANVVLAARGTEALQAVAEQVEVMGGTALVVTTDVSDPEAVQRLAQLTVERFGRIDVWINNAGVGVVGAFDEVPVQDHVRVIEVNLNGVIYGSHVALRQFRQQGQGVLVNIGSVESELPLAYQSSYAASKAAIRSLGQALTEELRLSKADNIAVATVLPWAADTAFFDEAANYTGRETCMFLLDEPDKVVDAIVWVSLHPQEELAVGWKAKGAYWSHRWFPDFSEWVAASLYHRAQMNQPVAEPPNTGNLYAPLPDANGRDEATCGGDS